MKYISFLIIGFSLLVICETANSSGNSVIEPLASKNLTGGDTIKITSSPALLKITTEWVTEFEKSNTGMDITVSPVGEKPLVGDISFVSSDNTDLIKDNSTWKMIIGYDVIIPVISKKNPMLNEIIRQGMSREEFTDLFNNPSTFTWSTLIRNGQDKPANIFMIDNESIMAALGNFIKTEPSNNRIIAVSTIEDLTRAMDKDIFAIGFCKLADICKTNSNEIIETLHFLPIDKNGNDLIDHFENIYATPNSLARGAWIGKYPNALSGGIYAIAPEKPSNQNTLLFLTWVMTEGGKFLNTRGYSDLAGIERTSNLNSLLISEFNPQDNNLKTGSLWFIFLAVLLTTGLIFIAVVWGFKNVTAPDRDKMPFAGPLDENLISAPKGVYFDKTHTWAFMEKDGNVRVGIDDFIQHITGTITRVKMKDPGETVRRGEKILSIVKDGKQLDIYAPVSGKIKEKNYALLKDSSLINSAPYSEGWVYMIEPRSWLRETEFLFMSEKYKEWLKNEFTRLKDFFAQNLNPDTPAYAHIILQDGGQMIDSALADLGPEVWEDFQTKFIDPSR